MAERFPELAPAQWDAEQRKVAETLTKGPRGAVRGPYVPLIYSPELAERMRHLGDFIRFAGVLPPRVKEIVIFTVGRHWSAEYMFGIHRQMSQEVGIEPALIDAIAAGRRPEQLTPPESAAYDAARELLRVARLSDATFAALKEHFGAKGAIELVSFVGYYTTLAMVLNTADIAPPDGTSPLPKLGR
ncbi:MAG TPA: carboxymuconolactone decarboxylase family protein [Stellaceae bacterium]|nr:carboxymuconolactone decarboxylase family protein [Stellaceae bacterium]